MPERYVALNAQTPDRIRRYILQAADKAMIMSSSYLTIRMWHRIEPFPGDDGISPLLITRLHVLYLESTGVSSHELVDLRTILEHHERRQLQG